MWQLHNKILFLISPTISDRELYCSKQYCTALEEDPEDLLFEEEGSVPSYNDKPELPTKIDGTVFRAGYWNEDIEFV